MPQESSSQWFSHIWARFESYFPSPKVKICKTTQIWDLQGYLVCRAQILRLRIPRSIITHISKKSKNVRILVETFFVNFGLQTFCTVKASRWNWALCPFCCLELFVYWIHNKISAFHEVKMLIKIKSTQNVSFSW